MWRKRGLYSFAAVLVLIAFGGLFVVTRPDYAWLTFGRQERMRLLACDRGLWISLTHYVDGQRAHVERFRNWSGCVGMGLNDPDGQTKYVITGANTHDDGARLLVSVAINGPFTYEQYCDLPIDAPDRDSARTAHFHGPLTIGPVMFDFKVAKQSLNRGNKPSTLRAFVGTIDVKRGCWVVVKSHRDENRRSFPDGIQPEVTIEFPFDKATRTPIRQTVALDQVCCGALFYSPVFVPPDASAGLAKATFSFPAWSEAQVASTTVELPIVGPSDNTQVAQSIEEPGQQ